MDELASAVEDLEDILVVHGVEDLHEFWKSIYGGLRQVRNRGIVVTSLPRQPPVSQFLARGRLSRASRAEKARRNQEAGR